MDPLREARLLQSRREFFRAGGVGLGTAALATLLGQGAESWTPELARFFLAWEFSEEDRSRMNDLTERNQAGTLSSEEKDELIGFSKAGCLLGILHARARKCLTRRKTETSR